MYMANESFGRRVPFVFLQNIQSKLLGTYTISQILDAPDYGINALNKVIEKQIDFHNNDKNADKLKQVQDEIDQIKGIMTHNIEQVLERDERIDILVDKTDGLNHQAFAFKKRSTLLKVKLVEK